MDSEALYGSFSLQLTEVKYRHSGPKPPPTATDKDPPSFLWTLGPRPFWELWPNKKRRKKLLSLDDFARSLLEQWAKTYGYPIHGIGENVLDSLKSQIGFFEPAAAPTEPLESPVSATSRDVATSLSSDSTRSRRLIRSIVRVSRRYHILERISRRLQTAEETDEAVAAGNNNNLATAKVNGERDKGHVQERVPPVFPSTQDNRRGPLASNAEARNSESIFRRVGRQAGALRSRNLEAENLHQLQQLHSLRNGLRFIYVI